ncbi:MAG: DUF2202 domain-containing protein [Anaerolineae bacterium]|jgi:hypothetical protein
MKKLLTIGALVLVGVLVVGTVAVWALPANGPAAAYGRQGEGRGQAVADPVNATRGPAVADPMDGTCGATVANPVNANRGPAVTDPGNAAPIEDLPLGDLSDAEAEALRIALEDEYKAWSVYEQVIADFGAVRPFTQIQKAEEKHIDALVTLFERYGLEVPANEVAGTVPSFDTLADACEAGVQAEIDNAALYDQLFDLVDNPDLIRVFTSLQQASQTKHLPAFERCAP